MPTILIDPAFTGLALLAAVSLTITLALVLVCVWVLRARPPRAVPGKMLPENRMVLSTLGIPAVWLTGALVMNVLQPVTGTRVSPTVSWPALPLLLLWYCVVACAMYLIVRRVRLAESNGRR